MTDEFDYGPLEPQFATDFPAPEPPSKPLFDEDDLRVLHTIVGDLVAAQQAWTEKKNQSLANFAISRLTTLLNEKDPK